MLFAVPTGHPSIVHFSITNELTLLPLSRSKQSSRRLSPQKFNVLWILLKTVSVPFHKHLVIIARRTPEFQLQTSSTDNVICHAWRRHLCNQEASFQNAPSNWNLVRVANKCRKTHSITIPDSNAGKNPTQTVCLRTCVWYHLSCQLSFDHSKMQAFLTPVFPTRTTLSDRAVDIEKAINCGWTGMLTNVC
jgi:hypothetical protein